MKSHGERLSSVGVSTGILGGEETLNFIQDNVALPLGSLILDGGCHGGTLSFYLADIFQSNVVGLDLSTQAIELAKSNRENITTSGAVDFVRGDFLNYSPSQKFDLVVHRGLEAFTEDTKAVASAASSLLKNWGYLVVITHLYEKDPGKFIDEVNESLDMRINYESKSDFIARYEKFGSFKLLRHSKFSIEKSHSLDKLTAELKKDQQIIEKNDKLCSGNVFVFRKYDSFGAIAIDADKA